MDNYRIGQTVLFPEKMSRVFTRCKCLLPNREILPIFLHDITAKEWDTIIMHTEALIQALHNTSWSTMAKQVAVRQHVPPPPRRIRH